MNLESAHNIYFLGIGGIGMSALARFFKRQGKVVYGYDRVESKVTQELEKEGIPVFFRPNVGRIEQADLVVYTPAVPPNHIERMAADSLQKPTFKRAEILGHISRGYHCIAVAGTHGKTTTSVMVTHLLRESGLDVTAFLGGLSVNLGGNFVYGKSKWLVVEADEYDRSFLHLHPDWAIINSLDPDHLDIYGSADAMKASYRQFASQSKHLLIHESLLQEEWPLTAESFGKNGGYQVSHLRYEGLSTFFDFEFEDLKLEGLALHMPGEHNVMNMAAACAISLRLGAGESQLRKAVSSFKGIYRRFEVQLHGDDLTFIDDYAHHPAELAAVISTARELFPDRKLVVVFQPHLYSRTRDFQADFAKQLDEADAALLLEIYPAREEPIDGVDSSAILAQMTLEERKVVQKDGLWGEVLHMVDGPTVLLTLGAGDIDKEVPKLKASLEAWQLEQKHASK